MDGSAVSINVSEFIKDAAEEVTKMRSYTDVIDKEKYNIRARITRYKDDPRWLLDSSRECCELATVRKRQEFVKLRASSQFLKRKCLESSKYASSDAPWTHAMVKKGEKSTINRQKGENTTNVDTSLEKQNPKINVKAEEMNGLNIVSSQPEVIISLHYHKPIVGRQKLMVYREFQALGSTLLTDLRDHFPCISDEILLEPLKSLKHEDIKLKKTAKDQYKSGYLFINDTFYNDFRHQQNIDYSQVVIDWAEKKKQTVGPFKSENMNGIRMRDLSIKQNQPYLYCHQGNCEHIFIITDLRVLNPLSDVTDPLKYPLESLRRGERRPLCNVCHLGPIRWVLVDSPLCPEAPCYVCNSCIRMLHCSPDGKLNDPSLVVHLHPRLDK